MKHPRDGWIPLPLRTLVPAKKIFTAPNNVYGNCIETSVDVQSYRLASCPGAVVAAGTGGSTATGGVLAEDAAALAVPRRPLLQPRVPLGACCPGAGYVRSSMAGLDALTRQQPRSCRGCGSPRWVSLRTHVWLAACFHFVLRKGGVMGEE